MEIKKSGVVRFPGVRPFHIEKFHHPDKVKISLPKKPVKGRILIIRGPSGGGKTTIAELLADEFAGTKNKIKIFHLGFERRKENLGFSLRDKDKLLFLLKQRIDFALLAHRFVVLDEVFDFKEEFSFLRKNHPNARILVIHLECPIEVSIQRSSSRKKGRYYTPLSPRHIEGLWYMAHLIKCGYVIDSNNNIETVFENIVHFLKRKRYLV